ncbi:Hypothetical protein IALB_3038 [Ignavibacterium album JCM 16511]|uniref:Uncharacterized protein n=1 Tax=Ignavibacterium album (strain DSM 19864 / JCM 16511 / NBRC 101810 / Mat9-16) TaxID=945713 RepID=I0AP34_IGNAJ|nr:Hypothetical protein IALB_3038 [Ignavibacterium album JCM 16511]
MLLIVLGWFNILKEQVESKSQPGVIVGLLTLGWFNILKEQVESKSQLMVQQHFTITRWFNILKESRLVGKSKSQQKDIDYLKQIGWF